MRGRRPSGPEYVQKLQGSPDAKERLTVILETLFDRCRVLEACDRLAIAETRFHQIRIDALQAALEHLESRPAGRPPRIDPESATQIRALEAQVQTLQVELRAAHARAEIALALSKHSDATPTPEKKTTRPRRRKKTT
jgi:uncharacterized membrane protein YccC